ncbi:MAG: hypothetical protein LBC80_07810 [Treponema sp.]|jgi:hypothetical protein|nr:hypothetical protein [Treponema sp.]
MKKKQVFTAMLVVILAFGFAVSCNESGEPPVIPLKFVGTWEAVTLVDDIEVTFNCLIINSNGTGEVFFGGLIPCTFEHFIENDVEKLKMIIPVLGECTFDASIVDGDLHLENPEPDVTGAASFLFVYSTMYSPYSRHVPPETGGVNIPAALEGSWKATQKAFAGQVVFVINTANPQVYAGDGDDGTGVGLMSCIWDVETEGKLTLKWGALECTFDYEIDGDGKLILKTPVPIAGSEILAGYVDWGPFEKVVE